MDSITLGDIPNDLTSSLSSHKSISVFLVTDLLGALDFASTEGTTGVFVVTLISGVSGGCNIGAGANAVITFDCHIHFKLPSNSNTSSNLLISNTGNQPPRFNFGFGNSHSHLIADLANTRHTILQTFNFGFPVLDPVHHKAVMPPHPQKFNFGFMVTKQDQVAMDPTSSSLAPTKFDFGWTQSNSAKKPAVPAGLVAVNSEPTPSSLAPTAFNFGLT
ncbi:hypothetical protein BDR06DRAFT_970295 [Suillus hirtellus]|nr:hypothetical protein BDR06DRAFT_970295 [Suillus hirtellus]